MEETTKIVPTIQPKGPKFNHEPEILMGVGLAGLVLSIAGAVRATVKAVRMCDAKKQAEGKEKLTKKEIVKLTWKTFAPVAASTVLSIPCVIMGNRISNKRAAALAAAYSISESALQQYQAKAKEIVGEKTEQVIKDAVTKDQAQIKAPENKTETLMMVTNDEEQLIYEPLSDRYFKSTWNKVMQAYNELNEKTLGSTVGVYSVNDWYDMLGIDNTKMGDMLGWCTTTFGGNKGLMRISLVPGLTKDNKPCCAIQYDVLPYCVNEYIR